MVNAPTRRGGLIAAMTRAAIDHPLLVLVIALAATAVSVKLASGLEIRSSFQELGARR